MSAKPRPCWPASREAPIGGDPLPSWSQGAPKAALLDFLRLVSEPGKSFVPPPERVAVFDNDGTLWCEKPMYPQADFLLRRWQEMVQAHPGLTGRQPWRAVSENDRVWLTPILDHVRVVSQELYGIPRDRMIGSGTTLEYRRGRVWRTRGLEQPIDDGPGKPIHIWTSTGRMPLLAGGNADGDAAMLECARFALLIRHDADPS